MQCKAKNRKSYMTDLHVGTYPHCLYIELAKVHVPFPLVTVMPNSTSECLESLLLLHLVPTPLHPDSTNINKEKAEDLKDEWKEDTSIKKCKKLTTYSRNVKHGCQ